MDVMGFLKKVFMAEGKKSQKGANQTSPSLLKNVSLRDWRFCYVAVWSLSHANALVYFQGRRFGVVVLPSLQGLWERRP